MKIAALAALVLSLAAGAAAGPDEARIYAGHLPGAAPENVGVVQVLDARTGRPVEGVSVRLHRESAGTGFTGADLLGRTATDAFGLASIAWPHVPDDGHWVFEAEGYAVLGLFGAFPPDRVWLRPGGTVSARILDPFGRPAAGVTAELILGCGHSPVVRIARTNAEGVLKLRDVEPGIGRVWVRTPGAKTEAFYLPPDGGDILMDPGTSIEGTVVDVEEKPVAGVVVASLQSPRGPTAVTDEKGRFRLDGVEPEGEVWFLHPSWHRAERPFFVLTDVDLPAMSGARPPLRLILPPETVEGEDEYREILTPKAFAVPVRVIDARTGEDLPDVSLLLTSLRTGLGVPDEEEEDEECEPTGRRIVTVEPGEYLVSPGSPFARWRIGSPERVTIGDAPKDPIVFQAVEQARLGVTGVTEEMDVRVVVATASADVEDLEGLPPEEPAVVVVRTEGGVRFFPVGPAKDGVRRVTVEGAPPPPLPEDESGTTVGFPSLRLLDAGGRPIADRAVRVARHRASSRGATDADGCYRSRWSSVDTTGDGPSSTPFVLEVEGWVTRVVAGAESGPREVRYPAGIIEMTVVSPDGSPLDFAWCVDGMTGMGEGGKLALCGVEPGRRIVVVGAKEHESRLFVVAVPEEGATPLRVVLSREPAAGR